MAVFVYRGLRYKGVFVSRFRKTNAKTKTVPKLPGFATNLVKYP